MEVEGIRIVAASLFPLKNGNYVTTTGFSFACRVGEYVYRIDIDKGFEFDGATVPKWLWPIAGSPFQSPRVIAAMLHDWLYTTHVVARSVADAIFYEAMIMCGCKEIYAKRDYLFVKVFGGFCWKNNSYEDILHATELGRLTKSLA